VGELARVKDFIDEQDWDDSMREWAYLVADLGAVDLDLLDTDKNESEFGLLRYILSTGHEYASMITAMLLLLKVFDLLSCSP
jgi:hypothetical protein